MPTASYCTEVCILYECLYVPLAVGVELEHFTYVRTCMFFCFASAPMR